MKENFYSLQKNKINIWANGGQIIDKTPIEIVERKGIGHPDTICDVLAEKISNNYSLYCLENFGVVLRHMVDKIAILGGKSKVSFGSGEMIEPIRLLLNCRFTKNVNNINIPYLDICKQTIFDFFGEVMPTLDVKKWLVLVNNIHFSQGPGVVYDKKGKTANERAFFFSAPNKKYQNFHDNQVRANDTSTAVAYYPLSKLENLVIFLEKKLNSREFKLDYPYVGTDIKIMAKRINKDVYMTLCIPFISKYSPSLKFYLEGKVELEKIILKDIRKQYKCLKKVKIFINTRDNISKSDLYLTVTGSAIESGDEGVVGRGNRYNGVIPFTRRMSMEACCGKNPVYHVGKIYTACSDLISKEIFRKTHIENTVYMTGQMGRALDNPLGIDIEITGKKISNKNSRIIESVVSKYTKDFNNITKDIILGEIVLY